MKNIDKPENELRTVKLLSVVIPCHNEEEVLPGTHQRLRLLLDQWRKAGLVTNFEIVYVNNGSTDQTQKVLEKIFKEDRHAHFVTLRRNFGYQGSISAGIFCARGDVVVSIDSDLQDPPEKIPEMLEHYKNGYDLVLGVRKDRSSDSFLKRIFSENYYSLLKFLGVEIVHNHGDFRLMSRSLVDEFNQLEERNRFIRAMILTLDSYYAVVEYERTARAVGHTKFNVQALLSLSLDGIMSFSYMPLRLISISGLVICAGAFICIIWVLYIKIVTHTAPGWASTLLPIFAFGGFQIFVLGVIGEYIGRLYLEVKKRPLFSIRREYKHD